MDLNLRPFQTKASTEIAERCLRYLRDPLYIRRDRIVPFYQQLTSITGSGKTLILADTVAQIRARLPVEPVVLWLSKGRVVVLQTLSNLSPGGKYSHFLPGYTVKPLLDCKPEDVLDSSCGLLLVATVGKFNQKDKGLGDRKIFQVGFDAADKSLWDLLGDRHDGRNVKRPLIVVYDEGHNLSDQQTGLLLELGPDALIAASATMRIPDRLGHLVNRLRNDAGWVDSDFSTSVRSSDVVGAGLIKKHIMLGGYMTQMEIAINDMLVEMKKAEGAARSIGLPFLPKAIYVSTTNTVDGTTISEDMARPFSDRKARPILIWRHLVDRGVDPEEIAIYCDLKFSSESPPPSNLNLFTGGDSDYDRFVAGKYRHVIFNLSLQEGWDDPTCSFAYIDKEMGSADQVTQVIGRVLRQPGAQHYPPAILNTAHFYIRTDQHGVFEDILERVERTLVSEVPEVSLSFRRPSGALSRTSMPALVEKTLPTMSIDASVAHDKIRGIVSTVLDFRNDTSGNVIGKGERIRVLRNIGSGATARDEWTEIEHGNLVTARWIFIREIQKSHPKAVSLCDTEHPKFDAFVEYSSPAADHLRQKGREVAQAYVEHSRIVGSYLDHPYRIGDVPVDPTGLIKFRNSIHEGYSDLNGPEYNFAVALDRLGFKWYRNPPQSGYGIPLLDFGGTQTFFPDFIVWSEGDCRITAIDTKGKQLIDADARRKLLEARILGHGPHLAIRFVTEGQWSIRPDGEFAKASGVAGYTVWLLKDGKPVTVHCSGLPEAITACLSVDLV